MMKQLISRPSRLSYAERKIVDKQVLILSKIFEPYVSEYGSEVVVVRKKDGTPRMRIDCRKINKNMVKDSVGVSR